MHERGNVQSKASCLDADFLEVSLPMIVCSTRDLSTQMNAELSPMGRPGSICSHQQLVLCIGRFGHGWVCRDVFSGNLKGAHEYKHYYCSRDLVEQLVQNAHYSLVKPFTKNKPQGMRVTYIERVAWASHGSEVSCNLPAVMADLSS